MMNEGVKILLERIKTNPDEFMVDGIAPTKWGALIMQYRVFLGEEDKKVLDDALSELMSQKFTEAVMKELLAPEEDNSLGKPWYSKQGSVTLSAGQTRGVSLNSGAVTGAVSVGGTWGTSTLQQSIARLEEIKKQYEPKKKHQTLFGKLFNYS